MGMKKYFLVAFSLALVLGLAESINIHDKDLASEENLWDLYERWRNQHTVSKDLKEKHTRFNVFKANVKHIHKANQMSKPYKLKLNKFADMTNHEFASSYAGSKVSHYRMLHGDRKATCFRHEKTNNLPPSVDWRKKGAVTGVKDQGRCGKYLIETLQTVSRNEIQLIGNVVILRTLIHVVIKLTSILIFVDVTGSCWAFSTVVSVEGINQIQTKELVSLSEQELVDCNKDNQGCDGGLMENAFEFIKNKGGITTENNYPYRARDGSCDSSRVLKRIITKTTLKY